jgi:hypothetical protein
MAEPQQVQGGCHCGAVRFAATVDLGQVIECNCSHCASKGFLLTFAPREQFELLSGAESLTEYRFNTHKIAHLFCRTCGVQAHGLGEGAGGVKMAAVNVRCLDDVDPKTLTITAVDGAAA